jgi:uncharacterized protein YoxC
MNLGKRILSALVEVRPEPQEEKSAPAPAVPAVQATALQVPSTAAPETDKFRKHFEQLIAEANLPGPDYFEFSCMIEAMRALPDEKARYAAAYAGLQVQGLDKQKLVASAQTYIELLETDAAQFEQTLTGARKEKVESLQQEIEAKSNRIQQLSKEINELHGSIGQLQSELRQNEEKIQSSSYSYRFEWQQWKEKIQAEKEKIQALLA